MNELVFIDNSVGTVSEINLTKQARETGIKISEFLQHGTTICVCNKVQPISTPFIKTSRRTKQMMPRKCEQASTASVSTFDY